MIAGAWICLLAPLAGALADHARRARTSRARRRRGSRPARCSSASPARSSRSSRSLGESPDDRAHLSTAYTWLGIGRFEVAMQILVDPRLAHDDADHHRRRRPDRLVLDRLHEGRGRGAPLLRLHGVLRLLDADARDGRQPAAAARRLGARRARVVPPDRLLPRPPRGDRRRQEGVHHERDRRRGDGARLLPADLEDRHARLLDELRRRLERRALVEHA